MAAGETVGVTTGQPNLCKQDLSSLDVAKLSALSPEVISRQATINIGTIGHVAHGKSTVVKAISGVQTVRFKNELERNITIKLGAEEGLNGRISKTLLMKEAVISLPRTSLTSVILPASKNSKMSESAVSAEEDPSISSLEMPVNKLRKSNGSAKENKEKSEITVSNTKPVENGYIHQRHVLKRKAKILPHKTAKIRKNNSNEKVYEVEQIIDSCEFDDDKVHYLVKWKGWDASHNTWEPLENLTNCEERLQDYFSKLNVRNGIRKETLKEFSASLIQPTKESLESLMQCLLHEGRVKYEVYSEPEVCEKLQQHLSLPEHARSSEQVAEIRKIIMLRALYIRRVQQMMDLKEWQEEINISFTNSPRIIVENEADLEGRPLNFFYVNDYIPGEGITIPEEPPIGCDCKTCGPRSNCCGKLSGSEFAYNANGTIRVSVGTPIYECNKRCLCSNDCTNRVVQVGHQVKLSIFRTFNGCGWGVKALQDIKKGMFVCEYVGEVISNETAEERGRKYDRVGQTYLFDLDYNENEQCPYTVDAAVYGNISHFINHSCNPNLAVYVVWINCLDPNLPKLALFSVKNIKCGEEITFDYMCHTFKSNNSVRKRQIFTQGNNIQASTSKKKHSKNSFIASKALCKCGSTNCRKYLF